VEQAYTRYALRVDPSLPRDDLMPPLDDAARPDGVIAWKPEAPAAEAAGQLTAVVAGLLSRGGA
jgi:hypothetical protein